MFSASRFDSEGQYVFAAVLPLFSSSQFKWIAAVTVLAVLLLICAVFLFVYFRRLLIFKKKCGDLESKLDKNKRELRGTKGLLKETSRSHRQRLDDAGAAIFELSGSGDCIYANSAMTALLGVPEGGLLGDGLVELVHLDDRENIREEWAGFAAREAPFESSFRFQRTDGKIVYVTERGGLLLNAQKKVAGYFGQVMDITPMRQSEQQFRDECKDLDRQLRDCEQKLNALSKACVEAERKKDVLAAELKQTQAAMVSREVQFEQILADRDKREEDLTGAVRDLEAQKAAAEETLEVHRKELEVSAEQYKALSSRLELTEGEFAARKQQFDESQNKHKKREEELNGMIQDLQDQKADAEGAVEESAEKCSALSSKLEAIEKEFVARKQQFEESRIEYERHEEELNRIMQELETQKSKAEDLLDIHRKKLEESEQEHRERASRLEELQKELADRAGREEELNGTIQELETRQAEAEEALETRLRQFKEEAGRRKQLEADLQAAQKKLCAEKEQIKSVTGAKISDLQKTLKTLTASEKTLMAERSRLKASLSETQEKMAVRTDKLDAELSKSKGEARRLAALLKKQEDTVKKQETRLKQLVSERAALERELKAARKEAETGRKNIQLQVKRSTAQQQKELRQLQADKKRLLAVQEKSEARLNELEQTLREKKQQLKNISGEHRKELQALQKSRQELQTKLRLEKGKLVVLKKDVEQAQAEKQNAQKQTKKQKEELAAKTGELEERLRERTHELTYAIAARRDDEQTFRKERKELQALIEQEKGKQARILDEAGCTTAAFRKERESWKQDQKGLQAQIQQLEELADERARLLDEATEQRVQMEMELSAAQREADRQKETVSEQIEQQTADLQRQLKAQREQEKNLKKEQEALSVQLAEMKKTLGERSREIKTLDKTRGELEKQVAQEKENLIQRIALFKDEIAQSKKKEEHWNEREAERMETLCAVEKQLEQKSQNLVRAEDKRKQMERDIERLKKTAAKGLRTVLNLTDDLTEPLTPVLDLCETVLQEDTLSGDLRIQLAGIQQNAQRLQTILAYRRELVLLEDGTVHAEPEWFDLNNFLEEITEEFNAQAEARRLFFAFSRKGDFFAKCRADHGKIRQVLNAFYHRAVERTSKGQIGLHTACEPAGETHSQISFLLVYNGLEEDSALTNALSDSNEPAKSCSELSGDQLQLDLLCRQVQLLGGFLKIENPSGRRPLLRFEIPMEQDPDTQSATDEKAAIFQKKAV